MIHILDFCLLKTTLSNLCGGRPFYIYTWYLLNLSFRPCNAFPRLHFFFFLNLFSRITSELPGDKYITFQLFINNDLFHCLSIVLRSPTHTSWKHFLFGPGRVLPLRKLLVTLLPPCQRLAFSIVISQSALFFPMSPDTRPMHIPSYITLEPKVFPSPVLSFLRSRATVGGVVDMSPWCAMSPSNSSYWGLNSGPFPSNDLSLSQFIPWVLGRKIYFLLMNYWNHAWLILSCCLPEVVHPYALENSPLEYFWHLLLSVFSCCGRLNLVLLHHVFRKLVVFSLFGGGAHLLQSPSPMSLTPS